MRKLELPLRISELECGDRVYFSGMLFTARDRAHMRLAQALETGRQLPVDLEDAFIYYCGPTATPRGRIIGSCGPTTASRMDNFTPALLQAGVKGMIGKGSRSQEVAEAIKKYKAVYFLTLAGCGALLSKYVKGKQLVAYEDLGPEAIFRLEVENFPLIVGIDSRGRSIYAKK